MNTQDGKISNMPQVFTIGPDDLVEMVHEGKNVRIVGSDFLASIADQIEVTPGGEGGISVKGPFRLFEQERGMYRITNFDSQKQYDVSADVGSVKIFDDNIQYVAPATAQKAGFAINGKSFTVDVISTDIDKPSFIPVSYGDPNIVNKTILKFTPFQSSEQDATHVSTVWQFSTSPDFISIISERTEQGAVVSTNLDPFKSGDIGYVRVKYISNTGQESQWSEAVRVIIKVKNDIENVLLNEFPIPSPSLTDNYFRSYGLYLEKMGKLLVPGFEVYEVLGDSLIKSKTKINKANFSGAMGGFRASPSNQVVAVLGKPSTLTAAGRCTILEYDVVDDEFKVAFETTGITRYGDVRFVGEDMFYLSEFDTVTKALDSVGKEFDILGAIHIYKKIDGQWTKSETIALDTENLPTKQYFSSTGTVYAYSSFDVGPSGKIYWTYSFTWNVIVSEKTENGWISKKAIVVERNTAGSPLHSQMHVSPDEKFVVIQNSGSNEREFAIHDLRSTSDKSDPVFRTGGNTDPANAYSINEAHDTILLPYKLGSNNDNMYRVIRRIGDNWVITRNHVLSPRVTEGFVMGMMTLVLGGQGFVEGRSNSRTVGAGVLRLYE